MPVLKEAIFASTANVSRFNERLNPLLIDHIELASKCRFRLYVDRKDSDGCYSARSPIIYWSIRIPNGWFNYHWVGEIAIEQLLSGRLRLRFYIFEPYWGEVTPLVDSFMNALQNSTEGFGLVIAANKEADGSKKQLADEKISILFISSSPEKEAQLRVDKEFRAIDASLITSNLNTRFDLQQCLAAQASDFQSNLLRHQPHILHFSGHGTHDGEIVVENDSGDGNPIPAEGLGKLVSILKGRLICVILNACNSARQAKHIAKRIGYVIAMSTSIGDEASIIFSSAFYEALGNGRALEDAFELGKNAILMHRYSDSDVPTLLINGHVYSVNS